MKVGRFRISWAHVPRILSSVAPFKILSENVNLALFSARHWDLFKIPDRAQSLTGSFMDQILTNYRTVVGQNPNADLFLILERGAPGFG